MWDTWFFIANTKPGADVNRMVAGTFALPGPSLRLPHPPPNLLGTPSAGNFVNRPAVSLASLDLLQTGQFAIQMQQTQQTLVM